MGLKEEQVAEVVIAKIRGMSSVWLLPIVAALIGLWLIYDPLSKQGPTIPITLMTAEGIVEGKTKLKLKNVEIGVVESVAVKEDLQGVVLTASMSKQAEPFLTDTTRVWVVLPRLSAKGVSGLGTLVSGAFIEVDPGPGGAAKRDFAALETPPVVKANTPGREFVLKAKRLGSLLNGSPIYFRGIMVGEVLGYDLSEDRSEVSIRIFIHAPNHLLVFDNTRFWNASGVRISAGADGMKLEMESLQSLVVGGVAFETPQTLGLAEPSKEGAAFILYQSEDEIQEAQYTRRFPWIMYFDGSVRGLAVGAPVEFKGLKVGVVKEVRLEFNRETLVSRIPVLVEITPESITVAGRDQMGPSLGYDQHKEAINSLIDHGLRARLKTGNLLTGKLLVDMGMHPGAEKVFRGKDGRYPEIPTIPSSIDEIYGNLTAVLSKIERLPLNELAKGLVETVEGLNRIVNNPKLIHAVETLDETMVTLNRLVAKVDKDMSPAATQTLKEAHLALKAVREAVSSDSALRYDAETMLQELAAAARSIRLLAEYLESNPNALIYGKGGRGER